MSTIRLSRQSGYHVSPVITSVWLPRQSNRHVSPAVTSVWLSRQSCCHVSLIVTSVRLYRQSGCHICPVIMSVWLSCQSGYQELYIIISTSWNRQHMRSSVDQRIARAKFLARGRKTFTNDLRCSSMRRNLQSIHIISLSGHTQNMNMISF